MFLKSLELNGFKSFPDKTLIEFSEGITSLLGPNGCGKSNIVDAIKWVLGAQSKKALRASSMDDVIFKGTDKREPLNMAEVTLVIDNSEHYLPTDITELTIRRRLFRTGQSEYFINGEKCLLKNITDLFMDTGVGKASYSIMEQGKIDQILSNKPENRRYIFEEAAGISRYKHKIEEAENNIEKANENIGKLEILRDQAKKTYDRTRVQAEKAAQWEELKEKAFQCDVDYHLSRLLIYRKTRELRESELEDAKSRKKSAEERLSNFHDDMKVNEEEINSERRELQKIEVLIAQNDGKISGLEDKLSLLDDNYRDALLRQKERENKIELLLNDLTSLDDEINKSEESLLDTKDILEEIESQISYTENEISKKTEEKSSSLVDIDNLSLNLDEIASRLLKLSEELREEIEKLVESISSTSSIVSFEDSKENLISTLNLLNNEVDKENPSLSDIKRLTRDSINYLNDFLSSLPPVVTKILSKDGFLIKKERIESKESELRSESDDKKRLLDELKAKASNLDNDISILTETLNNLKIKKAHVDSTISSEERRIDLLKSQKRLKEDEIEEERDKNASFRKSIENIQDKIKETEEEKNSYSVQNEELKIKQDEFKERIDKHYSLLSEKNKEKEDLYNEINLSSSQIETTQLRLDNLGDLEKELFTQFYDKYSRNLGEYIKRMDDSLSNESELKSKVEELNQEIIALGSINHLAKDEFDKAEDEYQFYSKELNDCYKSKSDMQLILKEILDRSIELFTKTYEEIKVNFQTMFSRLFGGGRAELSLTDPSDILNSGIEISAEPPGKKLTALSLLSGGERTMTAIALLFAMYLVKPSPFCLLDEIDAALDATNIGYFLDVLKDFSKNSQFIIITHNKNTVTGGNSMLGVSQEEPGVSKAVSYKIGIEKDRPVILNEDELEVDFS